MKNILNSLVTAGLAAAVIFSTTGCTSQSAADIAAVVEQRPLQFSSGGVELAATWLARADRAPTFGAVMLPGSGPATRDMMRPAAEELARQGAAVLIFDKRGSGESGGDWITSSLDDLAADAGAAARALADASELARDHIGFVGHSQGVWVASRAVEAGEEAAFVVAVSGGGLSPRDVERAGYEHGLAGAGASPSEIAAGLHLVESYFEYLSGTLSRAALDSRLAAASDERWASALDFPIPSESNRANWRWVADFDAAAAMSSSAAPALVLLGGADHSIPVFRTVEAWAEILAASPGEGDRVVVFPGFDHHLLAPGARHHGHGMSSDPELWRGVADWIASAALD